MHPFVLMLAVGTCGQLCLSVAQKPKPSLFCGEDLTAESQTFSNLQTDDWLPQGESMVGKEQKGDWLEEEERRD